MLNRIIRRYLDSVWYVSSRKASAIRRMYSPRSCCLYPKVSCRVVLGNCIRRLPPGAPTTTRRPSGQYGAVSLVHAATYAWPSRSRNDTPIRLHSISTGSVGGSWPRTETPCFIFYPSITDRNAGIILPRHNPPIIDELPR
jgi:hypothetical protein